MIDRIFAPALTFVMLIGGTAAIASALFFEPRPEALAAQGGTPQVIVMEKVIVTGKRSQLAPQVAATEKISPPPASQAAEGRGVLLRRAAD